MRKPCGDSFPPQLLGLNGIFAKFGRDRGGAVALIFAIAMAAIFTLLGAAVDYSRLATAKVKIQLAADSAALAVAHDSGATTRAQRQQTAQQVVDAQFQVAAATVVETEPASGGVTTFVVDATASVPLYFSALLGMKAADVGGHATAVAAGNSDTYEIAMALDNTGSMASVINDLRTAATSFVNTVMVSPNVKVSVVPYVAAVNPGLNDPTLIDLPTVYPTATWNGEGLRWGWIAPAAGCTLNWGSGGGGTTPVSSGSSSSGDVGGSAIDMMDILNPFRRYARVLFGISDAFAQVTPNTIAPIVTAPQTSPGTGVTYQVPVGFNPAWLNLSNPTAWGGCDWLANGDVANHDLFGRINNGAGGMAQWKGCVLARPTATELTYVQANWGWSYPLIADFDVSDIPPDPSNRDTLFIPYFWPDEPDYDPATNTPRAPAVFSVANGGFHNNYLPDGSMPAAWGWGPYASDVLDRPLFKYDGVTPAVIKETWPNTAGPNASCPDAVQRLTTNSAAVKAKIANLGYWYNGGTVISEGLMWAWRTLSPKPPYADGKAYGAANNNKVIVLMTDGVNGLGSNGGDATRNKSDYSAYGYLGGQRLGSADGVTTFDQLASFLDARTQQACSNAKASGVKIYTILFNHGLSSAQATSATALLQNCATAASNFYLATDLASLNAAFSGIASNFNKLRLIK